MTARQRLILGGFAILVMSVVGWLSRQVWESWQTYQDLSPIATLVMPTAPPLSSTATAPPVTPSPSLTPPFDLREAGEIANVVSQARELLPRWEIPFTFVSEYDLSVRLYRRYEASPPFPVSEQRALTLLGLWPTDADVQADVVRQAQHAAALYLPEEGQLYLRRDWRGSQETLRKLLAYSYARALPEQHGNLGHLRREAASLDQRLALDALAEGDTWFTLSRYAGLAPDDPATGELSALIAKAVFPQWRAQDELLLDLNWLSLIMGSRFAAARYADGGIEALNAALRRPPRSTEQILHPDRYAAGDEPQILEPLRLDLGRSWELTLTETIGEALMQITFDNWPNGGAPPQVQGWGGDLLQVWEGPEEARLFVWQTTWDSGDDASTLYAQFRTFLPRQIDATSTTNRPLGLRLVGLWWENDNRAAFLYRDAAAIWLLWGDDVEAVTRAAQSLP